MSGTVVSLVDDDLSRPRFSSSHTHQTLWQPYLEAICKENLRLCVPGCVAVERFLIVFDRQVSPAIVYDLNVGVGFLQEPNKR